MTKIALGLVALSVSLASCQTLDTKILTLTNQVQKYCVQMETAATLADVIVNKPLTTKINNGITTYCNAPITDLPSALTALAKIMVAINAAGVNVPS